jgi:hypothetical protein
MNRSKKNKVNKLNFHSIFYQHLLMLKELIEEGEKTGDAMT